MQAVGSIVMGLRPEKMMDTDLKPRNLQTGATWKFPPTLLMAAGNDEGIILELINNTQAAMQTKVRNSHGPTICVPPANVVYKSKAGKTMRHGPCNDSNATAAHNSEPGVF